MFLFDVDNTLLDNDRVAEDLKRHLIDKVGPSAQRYWKSSSSCAPNSDMRTTWARYSAIARNGLAIRSC